MIRSLLIAWTALAVVPTAWLLSRAGDAGERRYALVVGVKDYQGTDLSTLKYTENDARELAAVLGKAGYQRVVLLTQTVAFDLKKEDRFPNAANIRMHLKALLEDRKPSDTVLVAFSGHGVHFKKENKLYFCPKGANLNDPKTLLALDDVYDDLKASKAGVRLLVADACRNDPLEGKAVGDQRLESVSRPLLPDPPKGVAALFSCSKGEKSYESDQHKHGFFMHFLIEGLKGKAANKRGEVDLPGLVQYVQDEVPEAVKTWNPAYRQKPDPFLGIQGKVTVARVKVIEPAIPPVKPGDEMTNTIGMKMVRIAPGRFLMGSPKEGARHHDNEVPQHEVVITREFFMGKYAVTRGQFRKFVQAEKYQTEAETGDGGMGYDEKTLGLVDGPQFNWKNTGFPQTDDHPVVNVTWNDAKAFCHWLSKKEGKPYRLPTEAEREYACRAGTTTRFSWGDNDDDIKFYANIADASLKAKMKDGRKRPWDDGFPFTAPVGQFRLNPWGLYDMHGNVWEWCENCFEEYTAAKATDPMGPEMGKLRATRGGCWHHPAGFCRSAKRGHSPPTLRTPGIGFRVIQVLPRGKGK